MGIIEAIGQGFGLANNVIDMIEDPARRAKARRMYLDSLKELQEKIYVEKDAEKVDALILNLIAAVHTV
jgi:hypothetical protein